jgi:FkbM family methyltransferase
MKVCNVTLNKERCILDIEYVLDNPLELTFIVSDFEMDCTYYIWDAGVLAKGNIVWIAPFGEHFTEVVNKSKNFSGLRCKIYHKQRLLQVVNLPYSDKFRMSMFSSSERDITGPSYMDFFHWSLCNDMDLSGTVIDAGANIGFFTLYALRNGAKKIYSIEPDVNAFFHLQKNFINVLEVTLINKALTTDCLGTIFYHADDTVASSQQNFGNNTIASFVETIDIESILRVEDTINMLKLDVEGSEVNILNSLPDVCFNKINQIFVEFHGFHGVNPKDIISRLESVGYQTEYRNCNENDIAGFIYAKK